MKYYLIIGFIFLSTQGQLFGQHLQEQDWAKLSNLIKTNDNSGFEVFLNNHDFTKSDESNEKYTFYNWKKTTNFYYGVRVNIKSGQVTYMTNDQNYVLKLFSRFVSEYSLIKSNKQGAHATTHIFESPSSTIAIKLDTSQDLGTHLLFAVDRS